MLKISKFLFTIFFILLGVFNFAQAADVHLLNLNVYAWNVFQYENNPTNGRKITTHINENNYDFITTQEDDKAWGYLTNPIYQLNSKYLLAQNARGDAMIYYDSSKWRLDNFNKIHMTPDSGGSRIAALATFTNKQTAKSVVVATTHLCIHWTTTPDDQDLTCGNRVQIAAHLKDANDLKNYLQSNYSGLPVILSGDFNSTVGGLSQGIQIKDKLAPYLQPVTDSGDVTKIFLGPTFNSLTGFPNFSNPTETIDFVYYNSMLKQVYAKLYTKAVNGNPQDPKSNPSDHEGQIVDFNFGDTPITNCPEPNVISAPYSPSGGTHGSTTINVSTTGSDVANITDVELLNNSASRMQLTPGKVLEKYDVFGSAPDPSKGYYQYYVRNICGSTRSSEASIQVTPTK